MAGRRVWQGCVCGREACVAGRRVWQEGMCGMEMGICGRGKACVAGGVCGTRVCMAGEGACVAGETATAAGGNHPTGTHSCFLVTYIVNLFEF